MFYRYLQEEVVANHIYKASMDQLIGALNPDLARLNAAIGAHFQLQKLARESGTLRIAAEQVRVCDIKIILDEHISTPEARAGHKESEPLKSGGEKTLLLALPQRIDPATLTLPDDLGLLVAECFSQILTDAQKAALSAAALKGGTGAKSDGTPVARPTAPQPPEPAPEQKRSVPPVPPTETPRPHAEEKAAEDSKESPSEPRPAPAVKQSIFPYRSATPPKSADKPFDPLKFTAPPKPREKDPAEDEEDV